MADIKTLSSLQGKFEEYRVPCLNLSNCEIKLRNSPIVGKSAKISLFSPLQERGFVIMNLESLNQNKLI